jgi:hypothetical protein
VRPAPVATSISTIFVVLVLLVGTSCGRQPSQPAQPAQPSPGDPTMAATPTPGSAGKTDLSVVVKRGSGRAQSWRLTCDPPGGSHPDPAAGCAALLAHGEVALPPVRKDVACTAIYGGPETARVSGTFQGRRVLSSFSRVNGCQITRWDLLRGLLPPGGV